ncbi:hypothetical protein V9T40_013158 [Parthenolecanium corni]|uniref:Uncharacterized protein n=1 Tax=Parthenolecanium corni TaxID=536013 RepID=A0AAN9Y4X3_9HEMI
MASELPDWHRGGRLTVRSLAAAQPRSAAYRKGYVDALSSRSGRQGQQKRISKADRRYLDAEEEDEGRAGDANECVNGLGRKSKVGEVRGSQPARRSIERRMRAAATAREFPADRREEMWPLAFYDFYGWRRSVAEDRESRVGYGPPSPVHFDSNEVGSHERFNAPVDFGNYASFSSGSPTGYTHPSGGYTKSSSSAFGSPYGGSGPSPYKSGKGGVSSSYISVVHGPAGGPGKVRSHGAYAGKIAAAPSTHSAFHGASFGAPSTFSDGKFGSSNAYTNQVPSFGGSGGGSSAAFGKLFGSGGGGGGGGGGSAFDFIAGGGADYSKGYEGGASDEVASYSSGGPSYATFTASKQPSFSPSFSHGSRGNAYSTSNINFGGGGGGGGGKATAGHGNFHPPSFAASFKPSGTKTYNRYHGVAGGPATGSSSSATFGSGPLASSESGYSSRALKAGYTVDGADHLDSGEDSNLFSAFNDGAGFKVQSSYSSKTAFNHYYTAPHRTSTLRPLHYRRRSAARR